jgi:uncharacterized protein with NRDE domain
MCLILLAYEAHPDYRFVVAANRDEFFARPTVQARFWEDAPHILAGRDLKEKGTWLGVTRSGRIAALTNFRDPGTERQEAPSRGSLVSGFLRDSGSVDDYLEFLGNGGSSYNGFNLIFGDLERLCWFSNHERSHRVLEPGIHGLSNHLLDTPWPKVERGKEALGLMIAGGKAVKPEELFAVLADRTVPPDDLLPETGVGMELERLLSPIFISSANYGTRSSTVILIDRDDSVTFMERSFNGKPGQPKTVTLQFRINGKH